MREVYSEGLGLLASLQKELEYPPKRKLVAGLVDDLVRRAHIKGDVRERYFRLLATCALLGTESMYNSFKPRRKHAKETSKEDHKEKEIKLSSHGSRSTSSSKKDGSHKEKESRHKRSKRRHHRR